MVKAPAKKRAVRTKVAPVQKDEPIIDNSNVDAEGRTPLHLAAQHGYVVTVKRLLRQEADAVNSLDNNERTPGHWAAFKGYVDIVKLLLEHGANVNARDIGGRTLLAMAVIGKQSAVETLLRANGGAV